MMTAPGHQSHQIMLTWIIPVYNGERYISQAVNSILQQPCGDFEIIIVNDGSTDSTLSVLSRIQDPRVKVINKENGGVSSARNCGIQAATSKYLAFLDADDICCKNVYTDQLHSLLQEDSYDLFSFSFYTGDHSLRFGNRVAVTSGDILSNRLSLDPFKHFCSFIYHSNLLCGENGVHFPEGIKIREDVAFLFLVYQRANKILGIDKNWFIYRNNIASVMHQNSTYTYIVQHSIPAWQWCKSHISDPCTLEHCDIRIFAEATDYIRLSCRKGTPLSTVKEILTNPAVTDSLFNYSVLWSSSKAQYEAFTENPRRYWIKSRLMGIPLDIVRFFVRIPILRNIYMRIKYKEDITSIV